jgi:hypothetical protein
MNVYSAILTFGLLAAAMAILVGLSISGSLALRDNENRIYGYMIIALGDVIYAGSYLTVMYVAMRSFNAVLVFVILASAILTSAFFIGLLGKKS